MKFEIEDWGWRWVVDSCRLKLKIKIMSYWYVFLKWGTYWWSSCFYHAICKNNRNCLILDASLGHATVLTVRKNLTVGYLLLTVISLWILLSETAILLMPFGYWFLRNGYSFLRKPYLKYLHFPCCIFAYKEKRTSAVSCLWAFPVLECMGATLAHVTGSPF